MSTAASRKRTRSPSPVVFHLTVGLMLAALLCVVLWQFLHGPDWRWESWIFVWLIAITFITFVYYAYDKARAKRETKRVPEVVLHAFALLGGSLGAYGAMRLFRHKTVKGSFRFVFWSIVILQVVLIIWIVKSVYFGS